MDFRVYFDNGDFADGYEVDNVIGAINKVMEVESISSVYHYSNIVRVERLPLPGTYIEPNDVELQRLVEEKRKLLKGILHDFEMLNLLFPVRNPSLATFIRHWTGK